MQTEGITVEPDYSRMFLWKLTPNILLFEEHK